MRLRENPIIEHGRWQLMRRGRWWFLPMGLGWLAINAFCQFVLPDVLFSSAGGFVSFAIAEVLFLALLLILNPSLFVILCTLPLLKLTRWSGEGAQELRITALTSREVVSGLVVLAASPATVIDLLLTPPFIAMQWYGEAELPLPAVLLMIPIYLAALIIVNLFLALWCLWAVWGRNSYAAAIPRILLLVPLWLVTALLMNIAISMIDLGLFLDRRMLAYILTSLAYILFLLIPCFAIGPFLWRNLIANAFISAEDRDLELPSHWE